ncbi:MAG: hypothetical protein R3B40_25965 [Polyangiales bacterium]|nr:hypothetical protein [Myxococcales bacterium]MCB9656693.1 hypothetical protein [Sandaracinaceae bacterium]
MTRLSALLLVSALASAGCADPTHHADWMSEIAARYADRQPTMSDICWPRAHDAGTYAESYCRSRFSSACNTKTQELGMGAQLEAGVRAFDVRPERMDDDYFTHHTTTCGGLGCLGARLQDLLGELRTFLDQHREFVVIEVGGFCGTGADDDTLVALITTTLGPRLYTEPAGETRPLMQRPLAELVGPDGGRAVFFYEGLADTPELRAAGRYSPTQLTVDGHWSNVIDVELLRAEQVARFESYDPGSGRLFELSWTLTQNQELAVSCIGPPEQATSIRDLAEMANPLLGPTLDELVARGEIRPGRIPNVLSIDFVDTFVTDECLRLTHLNLR